LDLKPYTPLTQATLREFVRILAPVLDRIQVTSVSDWAVRSLRRFSPELSLGFDPLLYLDLVDDEPRPEGIPPFRVGAYGLRDDHPLSSYQWGPLGEYFAARAAALHVQAPEGCEWYIRAELLEKALKAGFDWVQFLHQQGSRVDGWTINAADPKQVRLAETLVDLGVDELTTDTPALLAKKLGVKAVY
jgi:glycerophosphoryl diester phosphodiesterase